MISSVPRSRKQKAKRTQDFSPHPLSVSTHTLYSFFAHLFTSHEDSFDIVH